MRSLFKKSALIFNKIKLYHNSFKNLKIYRYEIQVIEEHTMSLKDYKNLIKIIKCLLQVVVLGF